MNIVTVDLDDTLISTHRYYEEAKNNYADYMESNFNFDKLEVINLLEKTDIELFKEMGLAKKRFPRAFIETTEILLEDESVSIDKHKKKAQEFGLEAFKTENEYKEIGFINGAEEMLNILRNKYDKMYLLTAGVPEVQNPKIRALNLNQWFDEVHIVKFNNKNNVLLQLRETYSTNNITHIGNSEKSDVQAAIDAGVNAVYIPNGEWVGTSDTDYSKIDDVKIFNTVLDCVSYLNS